jgi:hypothetical protein
MIINLDILHQQKQNKKVAEIYIYTQQYKYKFTHRTLTLGIKRCDRYSIIGRVLFKDLTGKPSMAITQAIKPCRSAPGNLESVICNLEKH